MKNEMIAKVLKEYRKNNNLSVRQVAEILENKSMSVAEKTILVLCEIYNIDDILGTFGYSNTKSFHITNHEKELIEKYRKHPELQKAVDKLLE